MLSLLIRIFAQPCLLSPHMFDSFHWVSVSSTVMSMSESLQFLNVSSCRKRAFADVIKLKISQWDNSLFRVGHLPKNTLSQESRKKQASFPYSSQRGCLCQTPAFCFLAPSHESKSTSVVWSHKLWHNVLWNPQETRVFLSHLRPLCGSYHLRYSPASQKPSGHPPPWGHLLKHLLRINCSW